MKMYDCSAKYRDACESGKKIYASYYRTLLMLNKFQLEKCSVKTYFKRQNIENFAVYGCNDITELFLRLCAKEEVEPLFIAEENPAKFIRTYPGYKIYKPDMAEWAQTLDMVIIMSNYNFNEIALKLNAMGVSYGTMVSIEEFLATVLCDKI